MLRAPLLAFAVCFAVLGCTHDYDQFSASSSGGAAADAGSGGTGGTGTGGTSGTGGTGGTSGTGGTGGTSGTGGTGGTSGTGGTGTGGTSGTGGTGTGGTSGTGGTGTGGAGGSSACDATQKLCGTDCVPLDDPQTGCAAASCDPCNVPNATAACVSGACDIGSCTSNFDNCDTLASNGCETDVASSAADCGACGRPCSADHVATVQCEGGLCTSVCEPGRGNCSLPADGPDDGCETNLTTNAAHCGSCANACPSGFACDTGVCACDSDSDCRASPAADATCDNGSGRCLCATTLCSAGEVCEKTGSASHCTCNGGGACAVTETCCQAPAGCKNLLMDPENCGACGRACPAGQQCAGGTCI